jgi:hypothetical protein
MAKHAVPSSEWFDREAVNKFMTCDTFKGTKIL